MSLVDRARNIITKPVAEWPVIAAEPATVGSLYTGYIIPLALIGTVCGLAASLFIYHSFVLALIGAVVGFVLQMIIVFVAALVAQALAPNFGGANDRIAALKWIAYASTPGWIAGIFLLIPILGGFIVLLADLFGLYLLFTGATPMMRVPKERSVGYIVIVIVALIVLEILITIVVGLATAPFMLASGAFKSMTSP